MSYHEEYFTTPDGARLLERAWLLDDETAGAVLVVHGFVEHSGRYAELAAALNQHGFAVYSLDLRGHGRSEGERVFVSSFEEYLTDLDTLLGRMRQREPGKPIFLFGHSMGGLIALQFALRRQAELRGLIVSGAVVRLGARVFPWLRRLAVVAGWLLPRVRLVRMGGGMVSRDPAVVVDFRRDPLVFHDRFPLRTGAEIIRAGRQIEARLEEFRLPLLILHGTGDVVTDPEGSRQLYARADSPDKTLKLYKGLYHDLLHEPEREQVIAELVAWLSQRTKDA
ncbi:MAG: lysophospholipase [Thermoguttaceae bacterium]|jgi:alpha-beta hydrolase superfamily lysophospholipase